MAERVIRFGVATESRTLKASTWRCWTNGGDDKSVYLTCREVGQVFHTSLHETGNWHTGFLANRFETMFEPAMRPKSRFTGQWNRPKELAPGWTIAAFIYTPWHAVGSTNKETSTKIMWVSTPPKGQSCEFCILLGDPGSDRNAWPGKDSMNTSLVGRFELDDGAQVVIVYRYVPVQEPILPDRISPRLFKGVTEADLVDGHLTAVMWGQEPHGAAVFYDAIVKLDRGAKDDAKP